jgi:hypothetical protein
MVYDSEAVLPSELQYESPRAKPINWLKQSKNNKMSSTY